MKKLMIFTLLALGLASTVVFGADVTQPKVHRTKSLDFEDEVVEGMNRNPLDSLQSVGQKGAKTPGHLYKIRTNVSPEMKDTAKEAGYTP